MSDEETVTIPKSTLDGLHGALDTMSMEMTDTILTNHELRRVLHLALKQLGGTMIVEAASLFPTGDPPLVYMNAKADGLVTISIREADARG